MKCFKVKAGALQLTMFIVVVIALLLAAFIILIHTQNRFKLQTNFVKETIANANYGIDYALHNNIIKRDTFQINLLDEDFKTVRLYCDYWGVFEKVVSTSKIKHNSVGKIALIGALQPKQSRVALYLKDNNKPLVVVGNTRIQGHTYLPKQGIRTGNISGHSYYGNQLTYGTTQTSNAELPKFLNESLKHFNNIQKNIEFINQEQFIDIDRIKAHKNSFYNPLQVIYSTQDIILTGVSLMGHILVQSKTKIIVDASSNLKDVILIAPEIEIKNYSKGTFQAFATKHISVGNHCSLEYPTALILNEDLKNNKQPNNINSKKDTPFIKINKGSRIKGVIAYIGNTKNYKAQIFIEDNAEVMGEVYCTQNLELLGSVYGSVFTSGFVANQLGSSYQNHLYNATISIDELPQEFVGLLFENSKKEVAKWLY